MYKAYFFYPNFTFYKPSETLFHVLCGPVGISEAACCNVLQTVRSCDVLLLTIHEHTTVYAKCIYLKTDKHSYEKRLTRGLLAYLGNTTHRHTRVKRSTTTECVGYHALGYLDNYCVWLRIILSAGMGASDYI